MKSLFQFSVLFLTALNGWCQGDTTASWMPPDRYHAESIDMHLNARMFLAGETLFFTVHCFNQNSGKLSDLSSIAYVELIGGDAVPLARKKIVLNEGVGSGDVFFAGNVPSGKYTIVAYTKWMRNFGSSTFYRNEIIVINPNIRPSASKALSYIRTYKPAGEHAERDQPLAIAFDRREVGCREKLALRIETDTSAVSLSVNIRLLDKSFVGSLPWNAPLPPSLKKIKFLPDIRSELISGRLTRKTDGSPLAKTIVSLSSPSRHYQYLTGLTDSTGRFFFSADRIQSDHFFLKADGHEPADIIVEMENTFLDGYEEFVPSSFSFDTSLIEFVKGRHLPVQIENAFYSLKKDSLIESNDTARFFATPDKVYDLENFMRFPSMEDVLREIVPEVVVTQRDGDFSLLMKNVTSGYRFNNTPLLLIDGMPVDANTVMSYNPLLVKTIALMARHYYYGPLESDGIVSIETHDGRAVHVPGSNMIRVNYTQPDRIKIYYAPDYDAQNDLSRVPDFRTQLYWEPLVKIPPATSRTLAFFTGDIQGEYLAEVVGVTSAGKRIYWRDTFTVDCGP